MKKARIIIITIVIVFLILGLIFFLKAPEHSITLKISNIGLIIPVKEYSSVNSFEKALSDHTRNQVSGLLLNISTTPYSNSNDILLAFLTMAQKRNDLIIFIDFLDKNSNEKEKADFETNLKNSIKRYPDPIYLVYTVNEGNNINTISSGLKEFMNKLAAGKLENGVIHRIQDM